MLRYRFGWSAGGLPLDRNKDTYAYRKNIAMLIDAGLSFDEIKQAAQDLYDENNRGGVYLQNNNLKVWVTSKETERKGYEIYALLLKITAMDDISYWEWRRESQNKGSSGSVDIQVAYLKAIKWLEVRGKFSTIKLTARTTYKVYFILKTATINGQTWGRNLPVTFRLYVPNKGRQEKQLFIEQTTEWKRYEVGEFVSDSRTIGTIEFHMEQLDSTWKHGLIIKGVRIEPQLNNS